MNALARLARRRRLVAILFIVLGAIAFLGFNTATNVWFTTARLDLTANGAFTLSDGTKNILRNLKEPIHLRFFYSADSAKTFPTVRAHAERVRDLLNEYKTYAGDKLTIEEIDPEPYTDAEDTAASLGLQGAPTQSGETVYMGLAGTNMADGQEVIPFFALDREALLEYDLTSLINKLAETKKPKLGYMSSLPLDAGPGGIMAEMQGRAQPYVLYAQLQQTFDLQPLDPDITSIPADIDALMIVHPKPLSQATLYAIDQFVMRGGRVIAFVDPMSEIAQATGGNPGEGPAQANIKSDLWLLKAWGVVYKPDEVVLDRARAQQVQYGNDPSRPVVAYPVWIGLTKGDDPSQSDFDTADLVTASLTKLNLASVGHVSKADGSTTTFTPLVQSSADSMIIKSDQLASGQVDPDDLNRTFMPSGEKYVIAARIGGPLKTAFPDGAPKPAPPKPGQPAPAAPPAEIKDTANANIIVVADTDLFDDRFWVQAQNQAGQAVAVPVADNMAFVVGATENMLGSNDLISLRARATTDRPFTVVEDLKKEADARFLQEEQDLNAKIQETQAKLQALQSKSPQGTDAVTLSPEQTQEIEKFRADLAASRTRLREVQRNLRADVDRLGSILAILNITLVPALLVIAAIVLAVMRRRRIAAAQAA